MSRDARIVRAAILGLGLGILGVLAWAAHARWAEMTRLDAAMLVNVAVANVAAFGAAWAFVGAFDAVYQDQAREFREREARRQQRAAM